MSVFEQVATDVATFRSCVAENKPYRPLYVKIKLTWRCNLRCVMCNLPRRSRENILTTPLLKALAEELAELGCRKVHFTGGEVTLRPDLPDLVETFAGKGMRVNLTTNGTLLSKELAMRLVVAGVRSVSISLDSPDPGIHDRIRGKGAWKRAVRGVENLRRAVDKLGAKTHIRINTVITRENYSSLGELPRLAADIGADRLTLIPVDDPTGSLRLNKTRILEFNSSIAPRIAEDALSLGLIADVEEAFPFGTTKEDIEYTRRGLYARGLYERQPCYIPWLHSLITPEGRVYACCMTRGLPRPLGNLRQASFRSIWEGESYRAFRITSHRPPWEMCHRCDDFLKENAFLRSLLEPV